MGNTLRQKGYVGMRLQMDHKVRTVALTNLYAMCERVSGMCHRFEVESVSANRVGVSYSNPDEYGNESPMTAYFPSWPICSSDPANRVVVLDMTSLEGDTWDGGGWQAFSPLLDCPSLWRSTPDATDWGTREEIDARQASS